MTQEEKQLLLKDLCARLPFGVTVRATYLSFTEDKLETRDMELTYYNAGYLDNHWIEVKPYLRPMSSMTEEEKLDWNDKTAAPDGKSLRRTPYCIRYMDWLNEHYFDYRHLIEKGLALEAPEGMYKTE